MDIKFNLQSKKVTDIYREYESLGNSLRTSKIINLDYLSLGEVDFYAKLNPKGIKYTWDGTEVDIENKNLLKVVEYKGFVIIENKVVDFIIPNEAFSSLNEREDFIKAIKYLVSLGNKEREANTNKDIEENSTINIKENRRLNSINNIKKNTLIEKTGDIPRNKIEESKKSKGNIILNYSINESDYKDAFKNLSRILAMANLGYTKAMGIIAILISLTIMFYAIIALGTNNTKLSGSILLLFLLEIIGTVMFKNRVKKGYINKLLVENLREGKTKLGLVISKEKIIVNKDGIIHEYKKSNLIQIRRAATSYILLIVGNDPKINPIIVPLRLFKNEKQRKLFKETLKKEIKGKKKEKIALMEKNIFGKEQLKKIKKINTIRISSIAIIILSPFIISIIFMMVSPSSNSQIGAMKVASFMGLGSDNALDNLVYDSNTNSLYSRNVFAKNTQAIKNDNPLKYDAINSYSKAINVAVGDYEENENSFIIPSKYGKNMIKNDKSINNKLVSFLPYSVQALWQLGDDEEAFMLKPKEGSYDSNIKYSEEGMALISQLNYMSPYYRALKEAYIDNIAMNNMISQNFNGMKYMIILNNELLPSKAVNYLKEKGKVQGENNAVFVGPTELENNKLFRLVFVGKINKNNFKLFKVYKDGQINTM